MTQTALSVAPYAVVRLTSLAAPPEPPAATGYRAVASRLAELRGWCLDAAAPLADLLHEEIREAAPGERQALLAVRRDVHNQRDSRPATHALASPAADRLPLLARWFAARQEIGDLAGRLRALAGPALAAERTELAGLCDDQLLRRAVGLTSENLLRAVDRAAAQGSTPDERARKSEATVLRYALRATTRTTPLSWFTEVWWGHWPQAGYHGWPEASTGPAAHCQADRTAMDGLIGAVLRLPDLRLRLPHRLAPGLRFRGEHVLFRRVAPPDRTPDGLTREEQVELPLTSALRLVLGMMREAGSVTPLDLADVIASRLPGGGGAAARQYVGALIDEQVLRPGYPVDPQAADAPAAAAAWLRQIGLPRVAGILTEISGQTAAFASVPGAARPAALAGLRSRWAEAFSALGADVVGRAVPLTEDVVGTGSLALGYEHGAGALGSLSRLVPLLEVFDQYYVVRRAALDLFVRRYGRGGTCESPDEFAADFSAAWRVLDQLDPDGRINADGGAGPVSRELRELAAARAGVIAVAGTTATAGEAGELVIDDRVADAAARLLPGWVRGRPGSYAVFASPAPGPGGGTLLCLNQVFGGWGRFTSRFLPYLPPAARQQVRDQVLAALGDAGRAVQVRPVLGFNANLHPRIVDDEVGDDPRWATIMAGELHLVHDLASDALRLRVAATGELLDVLYLGFLVEAAIPDRLLPLATDLASGLITYAGLAPPSHRGTAVGDILHRPRLRYRDIVMTRRQWQLTAQTAGRWRADLDSAVCAGDVVARWRALLGLPEQVFIGAAQGAGLTGLAALRSYFDRAKSQYVDLGSALHQRALSRTLARYPGGIQLEEALPAPLPGRRGLEVVSEIYRRCP